MTPEQVRSQAERAAFFVSEEEHHYRMDFCEDLYFQCSDEETGDALIYNYDEIKAPAYFMELKRIES